MKVSCRGKRLLNLGELGTGLGSADDDARSVLASVKTLDLGQNELTQLSGLQQFSSLTALDVSENKLASLKGLPLWLVRLVAFKNKVSSLEGLSTLSLLQEVDVSYNWLTDVRGLPRASPITILKLSHNRLPNANGLEQLVHLQELELDHNYICLTEDVRALSQCRNLASLTLKGNPCADHSGYRGTVAHMIPSLHALDGSPVQRRSARATSPWKIGRRSPSSSSAAATSPARFTTATPTPTTTGTATTTATVKRSVGLSAPRSSLGEYGNLSGHLSSGSTPKKHSSSRSTSTSAVGGRWYPQQLAQQQQQQHLQHQQLVQQQPPQTRVEEEEEEEEIPGRGSTSATDTMGPNVTGVTATTQGQNISFDSVRRRADARRSASLMSRQRAEGSANELRRLLEDEHKLTSTLQKQKRKLESELSEARRVLANELSKLSEAKAENSKLKQDNDDLRIKVEKHQRDYKYAHAKLLELRTKHQEEMEKLKARHGVELLDMQNKLRDSERMQRRKQRPPPQQEPPPQHQESESAMEMTEQEWHTERIKLMEYIKLLEQQNTALDRQNQSHQQQLLQAQLQQTRGTEGGSGSALGVVEESIQWSEGETTDDNTSQQLLFAVGLKKWLINELEKTGQKTSLESMIAGPDRSRHLDAYPLSISGGGPPGQASPPRHPASNLSSHPLQRSQELQQADHANKQHPKQPPTDIEARWSHNLSIVQATTRSTVLSEEKLA